MEVNPSPVKEGLASHICPQQNPEKLRRASGTGGGCALPLLPWSKYNHDKLRRTPGPPGPQIDHQAGQVISRTDHSSRYNTLQSPSFELYPPRTEIMKTGSVSTWNGAKDSLARVVSSMPHCISQSTFLPSEIWYVQSVKAAIAS